MIICTILFKKDQRMKLKLLIFVILQLLFLVVRADDAADEEARKEKIRQSTYHSRLRG